MDELTRFLGNAADWLGVLTWLSIAAITIGLAHTAPVLLLPFGVAVAWWWLKRPG